MTGLSKRSLSTLLAVALFLTLPSAATSPSRAQTAEQRLGGAEERLMELEREFELLAERYNLWNEKLQTIQAKMASLRSDVERIGKQMAKRERSAVTVATELYKSGTAAPLEALFSSSSLSELEEKAEYLGQSEEAHRELFEELAAGRALLRQRLSELDKAREDAVAAQKRVAELRAQVEDRLERQRQEIASLKEEIRRARRAEQRRAALAEQQAQAAAASGGGASQAQPPQPTSPAPASSFSPPPSSSRAQTAVQAALSQVGKPYQWGAAGPGAYDCSGLTMWAWAQAGVFLPHNSAMQYAATRRVPSSDLQPGDLLFFGSPIHHVAMYIGGGQMVEAPYTGARVRVASSSRSDFVGAGRPGV